MAEKKKQHSYHACFDLEKEEEARAWNYLQHRDRKKFKSMFQAMVTAVNAYFEAGQTTTKQELQARESLITPANTTFNSEQLRQIMREEIPNALTAVIQNLLLNGIQANMPLEGGKVHQNVHEDSLEGEIADTTLAFLVGE